MLSRAKNMETSKIRTMLRKSPWCEWYEKSKDGTKNPWYEFVHVRKDHQWYETSTVRNVYGTKSWVPDEWVPGSVWRIETKTRVWNYILTLPKNEGMCAVVKVEMVGELYLHTWAPCQCMWAPCWQLCPLPRWSLNRRVFIHLLKR